MTQGRDEGLVLKHRADRNTDPFGQTVAAHRADDQTATQEGLENFFPVTHAEEDKVGVARHEFEIHLEKLRLEKIASLARDPPRLVHVRMIGHTRQGSCLSDPVGIEGLPRLLQHLDDFRRSQAVADAQIGQSLDFGKGAQHDDIAPGPHVLEHIGRLVEKFVISLVEDHHDLLRNLRHEPVDILLEDHRARGIVRIGNKNFFGPRRDRRQHAVKIGGEIRIRHVDNLRPEQLGHQPVDGKGMLRHHHLVAGLQISMPEKFNDLVGAITENDIGHA